MLVGYFYLRKEHPENVANFLEEMMEQLNTSLDLDLLSRRKEVISTLPYTVYFKASSSETEKFMRSLIPFSDFMEIAQRIGIEAVCKREKSGAVLIIIVSPYTQLIDLEEIFLVTQSLVEHVTDSYLTKKVLGKIESIIYDKFDVDRRYFDRKVLSYITTKGYPGTENLSKALQIDIGKIKEIINRLEREGKLPKGTMSKAR